MTDDFAVVDPSDVDTETFHTCEVEHRKLTRHLGCTDARVNQVLVEPGDVLTPHTHEDQEEIYVAITGGQIDVEGTVYDVPAGGVARVGPDPTRSLLNETDERHVWIAVGAPPVGTEEDFGNARVDGDPIV